MILLAESGVQKTPPYLYGSFEQVAQTDFWCNASSMSLKANTLQI